MVYDGRRGYSVLFGGQASNNDFLDDTWIYEGRRWHRRRKWWRRRPQPRCGHALAYDEELGAVALFGGIGRHGGPLGDTWLLDGEWWKQVRGPAPPPRRYAAFAYDPELRGCVLHGGAVDDRGHWQFGDTWLFRDRTWTRLPSGFDTDLRDDHGLAYHHAGKALLMLEGVGGARGVLARGTNGWVPVEVDPLHPRHQCSPLTWDDRLGGLLMHGGEVRHGGPQFDATLVLRSSAY